MTDLQAALAEVSRFHHSGVITTESVLGAHLRSQGEWATKKLIQSGVSYLAQGLSFKEAARRAIEEQGASRASSDRSFGAEESFPPAHPRRAARPVEEARPAARSRVLHREAMAPPPTSGSLAWFPKPNTVGDLNGTGAIKLLGTPNVPLSTVLVRETAQNSWDARLGHAPVSFGIHLRTLTREETSVLESRIFSGESSGLGLKETFRRGGPLRVVEISDRGTSGLSGPVRSDLAVPPGQPRNFIDLVFNIGAPRDVHLGAGTYGFGKTIAYRTSNVGTVLFWSRAIDGDTVEDRLIGSAFGPAFTRGGYQFTGRHWWGAVPDEQPRRVEPWTGQPAVEMAQSVFDARFDDDQTGTSLMIVDPNLGGADDEDDVQRLADAILWNLWPKLLSTASGTQPMRIELMHEGRVVPLPKLEDHPTLSGFADALQAVRATQNHRTYSPRFDTRVEEVRSQRPKVLLGHLAVTQFPRRLTAQAPERETVSVESPTSHIAWMRHDAELIVKYDERQRLENDYVQWAAVFKPVADVDDSFAASEPPAHDDWIPNSLSAREMQSHVRIAIRKSREQAAALFQLGGSTFGRDDARASVAGLADSLSKLIGGVPGSRPRKAKASAAARSRRTTGKPTARIYRKELGHAEDGIRQVAFLVGIGSAASPVILKAGYGAATEAQPIKDEELVRALGWSREDGSVIADSDEIEALPEERYWFFLEADADIAVSANFTTRLAD